VSLNGKVIAEGRTRDERNDTNDILNFKLEPNKTYDLALTFQGKRIDKEIKVREDNDNIIDIYLNVEK